MENLKNKKRMLGCIIIFVLVVAYLVMYKLDNFNMYDNVVYDLGRDKSATTGYITYDSQVEQSFTMPTDTFEGIEIMFGTFARDNDSEYYIELIDLVNSKLLFEWKIQAKDIQDNTNVELRVNKEVGVEKGKQYILRFSSNADEDNAVTLWMSDADYYSEGQLKIQEEEVQSDLYLNIITGEKISTITTFYIIIAVVILVYVVFIMYMIYEKRKIKVEQVFLVSMLIWGLIYMFILPPLSTPDEPRHFITAYKTSNLIMGKEDIDDNENVLVRTQDLQPLYIYPSKDSYIDFYHNIPREDKEEGVVPYTYAKYIGVTKIAHLPQSIGITIGRVLGVNYSVLVMMGRFANLLSFVGLVYLAIKIIPFGKLALFVITMCPMVLELASSFSYDALCMGFGFLFFAYLLHLVYEKDKVTTKDVAILFVTVCIASLIKVVYIGLVFLVFLIPAKKYVSKKHWWIINFGLITLTIFTYLMLSSSSLEGVGGNGTSNYIEWAQEEGYTLSYLIRNPHRLIKIYYDTIVAKLDFYFFTMWGGSLGWLELSVPYTLIYIYITMLLLATTNPEGKEYEVKWYARVWAFLIFVGIVALVMASMLLCWTPLSCSLIEGVQGRYFLPVLPLFILIINNNMIKSKKSLDYLVYAILAGANALVILRMLRLIILR